MATKRTDKPTTASEKPAPSKPASEAPVEALDPSLALNRKERRNMMKYGRFLITINAPRFARTRAVVGFAEADKQEGWQLFRVAGGEGVSLQAISENAKGEGQQAIPIDKLQALDTFENKWLPGVARIIARFAQPEERKEFLDTFFFELQQQPLGEGLLLSVPLLLQRVRELGTSKFKGAPKVASELDRRGLNAAKMAEIEAIVSSLTLPSTGAPNAAALNRAQRAQREAYEQLVLWWNDWSEAFRAELSRRDQITLGLTSPRKAESGEEGEEGEEGGEDDDGGDAEP